MKGSFPSCGETGGRWGESKDAALTSAHQPCDVCVRSHFAVRDLLDGLVDGEEEGLCLLAARHYLDSEEEVKGISRDGFVSG